MSLPHNLSEFEKYIIARWTYSIGQPVISDAEYNVLDTAMRQTHPDNEYCQRTWSDDHCPTELLRKYGMSEYIEAVVLGDKTESIPSLNTELDVSNELQNISVKGTLSMKHDGWNIQCSYFNGEQVMVKTRGRFQDALDVSALAERMPKTIPATGKVKVVCELTIGAKQFPVCQNLFSNVSQRSAVSSVLSRPEYHHLLSIHAFDIHGIEMDRAEKFNILKSWGFNTPMWVYVTDYPSVLSSLLYLSDQADKYDPPTDGVVYDGELRRAIRLLHWEEPIYKSFVVGYEEKYGPSRISPTVKIHPIVRKGSRQTQLSLTNWARIIEYGLQPGAPIAFRIASDATADFDEESTRALHTQWAGRWNEYQNLIQHGEVAKQWTKLSGYQ